MKRFITEYEHNGELCSDTVDADSWADAQADCDRGHRGEKVVGEIGMTIHVDDGGAAEAEADAWHSQYD